MQLEDIFLIENLQVLPTVKDRCKTYYDDTHYYKVWDYTHTAILTQIGLDRKYMGMTELSAVTVGLINSDTCGVYIESIYDTRGVCRGYVTHRGTPVTDEAVRTAFIHTLAEHSLDVGYGIVDVTPDNMVMYNGKCSIIDIDFCPIKLLHGKTFLDYELERWKICFYNQDGVYLNLLLDGIAQGKSN